MRRAGGRERKPDKTGEKRMLTPRTAARQSKAKKRQTRQVPTRETAEFEAGGPPLPRRIATLRGPPRGPPSPKKTPPRRAPVSPLKTPPQRAPASTPTKKALSVVIGSQSRALRTQETTLQEQKERFERTQGGFGPTGRPHERRVYDPRTRLGIRPLAIKWGSASYKGESSSVQQTGILPQEAYNPATTHALVVHDEIRSGHVRNPAAQQLFAGMAALESAQGVPKTQPGPTPIAEAVAVPTPQTGMVGAQRAAELTQVSEKKEQERVQHEFKEATQEYPELRAESPAAQIPVRPTAVQQPRLQTPTSPRKVSPGDWEAAGYSSEHAYRAHINKQVSTAKRRALEKKVRIVGAHRDIQKDLERLRQAGPSALPAGTAVPAVTPRTAPGKAGTPPETPTKQKMETPKKDSPKKEIKIESPSPSPSPIPSDVSVQELTTNVRLPPGGLFQGGDFKPMPALEPPALEQGEPPVVQQPRGNWMTPEMREQYRQLKEMYEEQWEEEKHQDRGERQREKQLRYEERRRMAVLILAAKNDEAKRWWEQEQRRLLRKEEEIAAEGHMRDQRRIKSGKGVTTKGGDSTPTSSDIDIPEFRRKTKGQSSGLSELEAGLGGLGLGDVDQAGTKDAEMKDIRGREQPPHQPAGGDYGGVQATIDQNTSQEMQPVYDEAAAKRNRTMRWHKGGGRASPTDAPLRPTKFTQRGTRRPKARPGGLVPLRGGVLSGLGNILASPSNYGGTTQDSRIRRRHGGRSPPRQRRANLNRSFGDLHRALQLMQPAPQQQQVLPYATSGQPVVITDTGATAAVQPGVVVKQTVKQEVGTKKARKKSVRFAKKETLKSKKQEYGRLKKSLKKRLMQRKKELYAVEAKRIKGLPVKERVAARKDVNSRLKRDFDAKIKQLPTLGKRKYNEIVALINKINRLKW